MARFVRVVLGGRAVEGPINKGGLTMLLFDCKPLAWYLVVTCPDCKTRQAILSDPSAGKATIERTYTHECDTCQSVNQYVREEIERHQHGVRLALD